MNLVTLLIANGALLQADDGQNGPNAVMQAVVDQNIEILEVKLIKAIFVTSITETLSNIVLGAARSWSIAQYPVNVQGKERRPQRAINAYRADSGCLYQEIRPHL